MLCKKLTCDPAAHRDLLCICVSTSLMGPSFPVFLLPRPHCCSHLHGSTSAKRQRPFTGVSATTGRPSTETCVCVMLTDFDLLWIKFCTVEKWLCVYLGSCELSVEEGCGIWLHRNFTRIILRTVFVLKRLYWHQNLFASPTYWLNTLDPGQPFKIPLRYI